MRLGLLLRGLAMGTAEVVPGVSGGTIAFVTGIYDELLQTLAGIDWRLFRTLTRDGVAAAWRQANANFLLWLGTGMLLGVVLFARLMQYGLTHWPPVVWSLFFGLIVYSIIDIARRLPAAQLATLGVLGLLLGLAVTQLNTAPVAPSLWWIFGGGALAVCAWLLPAVSGSFLLLVLGLYAPVLDAIANFEIPPLLALACGCLFGLLLFARALNWLMGRYRAQAMATLVGFMTGTLVKLWPWSLHGQPQLPNAYTLESGSPNFLVMCLVSMVMGMLIVWGLARIKA